MAPCLDQLVLAHVGQAEDGNMVMPYLHAVLLVSLPLDLGNTQVFKGPVVIAQLFDKVMEVAVRLLYVRHILGKRQG